jgi:predicted nucleotidyltransferase
MLTENDITHIISRIVTGYAPLAAGTFGSYAMGSAHLSSDLDLFVIKETACALELRAAEVRQNLFGILHPLDIHVFTAEEWEDEVYKELSFPWIVARQARLYHLAARGGALVPSLIPPTPWPNSTRPSQILHQSRCASVSCCSVETLA